MSDNLIIREDGVGRLIRGVDALEIKLQNGGTSRWVRFNPRDQRSVNANGEYHAKDDGVDGYRTITVNVPTRTKSQEPGRDQEIFNPDTGTGYYTDDEGMLHEELLPTEIRIMHVPDKTTYQDGEPIDLEGIVVQAYRDGEVWTSAKYPDGYIPVHELTIDPEIARGDANQGYTDWMYDALDVTGKLKKYNFAKNYYSATYADYGLRVGFTYDNNAYYRKYGENPKYCWLVRFNERTLSGSNVYILPINIENVGFPSTTVERVLVASENETTIFLTSRRYCSETCLYTSDVTQMYVPFQFLYASPYHLQKPDEIREQTFQLDQQRTYEGKTVYFTVIEKMAIYPEYADRTHYKQEEYPINEEKSPFYAYDSDYYMSQNIAYIVENTPNFALHTYKRYDYLTSHFKNYPSSVAWQMVYGRPIERENNRINVSWKRPKDEKTLSTYYEIAVEAAP